MNGAELIETLANDPLARLRWRVCREFCVLPSSPAARRMSDRQVVECGAQMVLDLRARTCPPAVERASNEGFDKERFDALSEGRA